jgi:AcrR family transcriptional regulator
MARATEPTGKAGNTANLRRSRLYTASARQARSRSGGPAQTRELRARGKRTMRKLLDAGIEVFATRGYYAARVDDIVKLAKTSHGTFYLYFANKEDLFRALAAEVSEEMEALADSMEPLTPDADGRERLHDWIDRLATLYEKYGPVIRAWTEAEMGSHEFGRLGNDVLSRLTRAVGQRISRAGSVDIDPVVASVALVAMLERLNYYVVARQVKISRVDMVDTLARVTHASLFGPARSS